MWEWLGEIKSLRRTREITRISFKNFKNPSRISRTTVLKRKWWEQQLCYLKVIFTTLIVLKYDYATSLQTMNHTVIIFPVRIFPLRKVKHQIHSHFESVLALFNVLYCGLLATSLFLPSFSFWWWRWWCTRDVGSG